VLAAEWAQRLLDAVSDSADGLATSLQQLDLGDSLEQLVKGSAAQVVVDFTHPDSSYDKFRVCNYTMAFML
jgi:dihydrodipicolinate reductase